MRPNVFVIAICLACFGLAVHAQPDLSLRKYSDNDRPNMGEVIMVTTVLANDNNTAASNITVSNAVPFGMAYVSHAFTVFPTNPSLFNSYNTATGVWGSSGLAANTDSIRLRVQVRVTGSNPVVRSLSEVMGMTGADLDSTPGNGNQAEDDIAAICVSVATPLPCGGGSVAGIAPFGYASYQWYRNGVAIPVAAGGNSRVYNISSPGEYIYTVNGTAFGTCIDGPCCPYVIGSPSCCNISNINLLVSSCQNNGTPSYMPDDTYTVSIRPTGLLGALGYDVANAPATTGNGHGHYNYGSAVTLGPFRVVHGAWALRATDTEYTADGCEISVFVRPPQVCSTSPVQVCN